MSKHQMLPSRLFAAMCSRLCEVPSSWIMRKSSLVSTLSGLTAMSPPAAVIVSAL